jgi:hypothetical protein
MQILDSEASFVALHIKRQDTLCRGNLTSSWSSKQATMLGRVKYHCEQLPLNGGGFYFSRSKTVVTRINDHSGRNDVGWMKTDGQTYGSFIIIIITVIMIIR